MGKKNWTVTLSQSDTKSIRRIAKAMGVSPRTALSEAIKSFEEQHVPECDTIGWVRSVPISGLATTDRVPGLDAHLTFGKVE